MQQKLTAQIAAMYWGSGLVCSYMDNKVFKRVYKFSEDGICDLIGDGDVIYRSRVLSECKLILTPLSEITDEHAIEVAKILCAQAGLKPMLKETEEGMEIAEATFEVYKRLEDEICVSIENGNAQFRMDYEGAMFFSTPKVEVMPAFNQNKAFNFLRSKSYDCDGLIEAGIAINSLTVKK